MPRDPVCLHKKKNKVGRPDNLFRNEGRSKVTYAKGDLLPTRFVFQNISGQTDHRPKYLLRRVAVPNNENFDYIFSFFKQSLRP